jgi:PKD repeat protein
MRAVFFDATATADPNGDVVEFTWTFGDGTPPRTTRSIGTTRHVYQQPGTYKLNLTVWETFGLTRTLLRDIVVGDGSLVGYWAFNENTGTTTTDMTQNGGDGTLEGGAGWTQGHDGTSALLLNAATQGSVLTKVSTTLNQLKNTLSISVWVYPTMATADTWVRIVSKKQWWDGTDGFDLEYNPNAGVVLLGSGNKLCAAWNTLPANAWSHIVAVANGAVGKIYINGVDHTDAGSAAVDPIVANTLQLTIGRFAGDKTSFWTGRIDNVRVYSTALTQAQVTSLFNAQN